MFRLLIKLGKFLEQRFPTKVIVLESDYRALQTKLEALEAKLDRVEKAAVHVDAVRTVVLELAKQKDELQSFKTSLGFRTQVNPDMTAVLNGEYLNEQA